MSNRSSGRWATEQWLRASKQGRFMQAADLRTGDTLRHEEWKFFDQAVLAEYLIRLQGVADLVAAGLTRPVPNSLGKTVYAYEKITFMEPAITSMDGISTSNNDRQEFEMLQLPLPITHKDFFLTLRTLMASRNQAEPLDTTQAATAGRVVAEQVEFMLFQGGGTFQTMPIYGYMTFPDRLSLTYEAVGGNWNNAAKTGAQFMQDVLAMKTALQNQRAYGPYWIYVPSDSDVNLDNDFKTFGDLSIRERLLEVAGVQKITVVDQLPSGNVIMMQPSIDMVGMVMGEPLQVVMWDIEGGMRINFKAMQIAIPLIRSDAQHRSGVCHMHS